MTSFSYTDAASQQISRLRDFAIARFSSIAQSRNHKIAKSVLLCLCGVMLSSCGYRVAGRGASLPAEIRTVAVPAFVNQTARYRIEQRLTEAVVRELLNRTKYRVVPEAANADAALYGEVTAIESNAVLFDAATGRATTMVVTVQMRVRMEEIATKKILWRNDGFLFREQFEISTDVASFFEEQDPALGRLSREFAAALVSALLEDF